MNMTILYVRLSHHINDKTIYTHNLIVHKQCPYIVHSCHFDNYLSPNLTISIQNKHVIITNASTHTKTLARSYSLLSLRARK